MRLASNCCSALFISTKMTYNSNPALGLDNFIKTRCSVEIVAMPQTVGFVSPILNNIIPLNSKTLFTRFKGDIPMGGGFNVSNVGHALNGGISTHRQFLYTYYEPVTGSTLVPRVVTKGQAERQSSIFQNDVTCITLTVSFPQAHFRRRDPPYLPLVSPSF